MQAISQDQKVPEFFPRSSKECKIVSETFFKCFNESSKKESDKDIDAGNRGLATCVKQKKAYETCMSNYEKKNPSKRFRVSNTKNTHIIIASE